MKVFIIGITGGVGSRLASLLKARCDEVGGLCRKPEQVETLGALGITGTLGDIAEIDEERLAEHVHGSDLIVFSAGAGGAEDDAMTDKIDGDGVGKSIAAATLAGVKRLLLVSVFPEAWRERHMEESFEHYIAVKKRADVAVVQSDLDWVILRPSALKDDPGVGTVSLGPAQLHTEIRRDDVAATLAELAHAPAICRQILEVTEGSTPIRQAVTAQLNGQAHSSLRRQR